MLTVIAYDIVDYRRRDAVSTLLADYGQRVNYSVFECELAGQEFEGLHARLSRLINTREDRIVLYRLCENCRPRKSAMGRSWTDEARPGIVIV
jgi:CRISPR-associated protein Cas2